MSYTKTVWENNALPAINATSLNNIENGIKENEDSINAIALGENLKGEFTPTISQEYPLTPLLGDTWYIQGLTDTGYTFTTGDTIGETANNFDKLIYSSSGWILLEDTDIFRGVLNIDSIADLTGVNTAIYSTVNVRGYYTPNDGGGGLFNYDATQSAVDNGGTVINGWVRQYDGAVNVKWFGAKADGSNNSQIIKDVCENFNHVKGDKEKTYTIVATDYGSTTSSGILVQSDTVIEDLNVYCTGNVPSGIHTEMSSLFVLRDVSNVHIKNCSFDSSSELDARVTSFEKGIYTYIGMSSSADFATNNIKVTGNNFTKNLGSCVGSLPSHLDGLFYYISDVIVSNNHFYDVGNHCYGVQKGYNNVVESNTMNNQIGVQFTGLKVGLFCDFSNGSIGCVCDGNVCDGVQTGVKTESDGYETNSAENNIISNNIFMNFKGEGATTSNYGIQLNGQYDKAIGNTIRVGVNPDTGLITPTLIVGLKTQSAAYKCSFVDNMVQVNGRGGWCQTSAAPTNPSYVTFENNYFDSSDSISIQLSDTFNGSIINNKLFGTSNLVSIQGLNSKIHGNEMYTDSPTVAAIYFNQPTVNIGDDNFDISSNKIRVETSGPAIGFNINNQYNDISIKNNDIVVKSDDNAVELYSTSSLVFTGNTISIDNPSQTADRRCLLLRSATYLCTDATITGNVLSNNGASFGNVIFGEFRNSVIVGNSLESFNACINLDGGQNTMISNNSWAGAAIVATAGTGTLVQNNIQKL